MRKTTRSLLTAGALAVAMSGSLLLAGPAIADTGDVVNPLSSSDESQVRDYFDQYGVAPAVQDDLIWSFKTGDAWDAFQPGAEPVSTTVQTTDLTENTIKTYADGSIAVTEVEIPTAVNSNSRAWGCTFTSAGTYGGYWKNCDVTVNLGVISQGFHLNYENIQGGGAKITSYDRYHHFIVGGALGGHRLERISNTKVRYSADLSVAWQGFPLGWTSWMQANLSGNDITTTHN